MQWIFQLSHEELNPYHQSLGRIITLLFACHAALYLNFYIQIGALAKRLKDRDVILGLCAISSLIIILLTSLARVRNRSYRLFFYLHVTISFVILPLAYFHVSHIRIYILEAAAVCVLLIIQRNVDEGTTLTTIHSISGTDLLKLSMKIPKDLARKYFSPGSHVFLGVTQARQKLRKNPFTIAEITKEDHHMHLVVRSLRGTTAMLKDMSSEPQPCSITLEGPYGSAYYFPELSEYDGVLLLAGGVGATFILPIYLSLVSAKTQNRSTQSLQFTWAIKDPREAQWGIESILRDTGSIPESLELYLTGHQSLGSSTASKDGSVDESIELEERQGLLADSDVLDESVKVMPRDGIKTGRPQLGSLVDDFFVNVPGDKIAVLVCGPTGMGSALRREVGRWVGGEVDIFWHNEEFGW